MIRWGSPKLADCQSATQQAASLRYGAGIKLRPRHLGATWHKRLRGGGPQIPVAQTGSLLFRRMTFGVRRN
jgi:hypothetical protein